MKIGKVPVNFDIPVAPVRLLASATAGNEYVLFTVPDLTALAAFGAARGASASGLNSLFLRAAYLINESATLTGQATNNLVFSIQQRRAGVLVNTNGNNGVLASVTTAAGTNLTQYVATLLDPGVGSRSVALQKGDVVSIKIANNGTGQTVPAGLLVQVDLDAYVNKA